MAAWHRISGPIVLAAGLLASVLILAPGPVASAVYSGPSPDTEITRPSPNTEVTRCLTVKPGVKFEFQGHPLLETPDIVEPELRLANALLSERCFDQMTRILEDFAAEHPDNYHASFVRARFLWIMVGTFQARVLTESVLRAHSDFTSMKILLASIYLEDKKFEDAAKLLDEVEKIHPEDLWLYMDRLRIEAGVVPTPDTVKTLSAIIADARFPPSARGQALNTAKYEIALNVPAAQSDEMFEQAMSSGSVNNDCALADQARDVIELRGDSAAGVKLIEKHLRTSDECAGTPLVRILLAEAYLLEAAKISPVPGPANATLARQAKEAMGGDLTPIVDRAPMRLFLVPILPFLNGFMDVRTVDGNGDTLICQAVAFNNTAMVKALLARGADPNGRCEHDSLVMSLLLRPTRDKIPEHQLILRSLLERGARVEWLDACASPDNGNCSTVYLPILKEFEERRAKTREVL